MDRLRQRADFLAVANGARATSAAFVLQGRPREDGGPIRVGFTVTKKNGTATERNRIRRRLRELVKRLDVISMRQHSDYVLVGRRAALGRDFATMLDDLRSVLQRLDRQSSKPQGSKPQGSKPQGSKPQGSKPQVSTTKSNPGRDDRTRQVARTATRTE